MNNDIYLRLSHISKKYNNHAVLKDIDFTLSKGEFISIVGKSGSGKSTLMNIIGLLEDYDKGTLELMNQNILNTIDYSSLRSMHIGFIFQNYNLISTLNGKENILLPSLYSTKKYNEDNLNQIIDLLSIKDILDQNVNTLSGGEKQRIAIARALLLDPEIILADEPTGNLDLENRDVIINILLSLKEKGKGIILITHDHELASKADHVFLLEDGVLKNEK